MQASSLPSLHELGDAGGRVLPGADMVGTLGRRFIFFNALRDGVTATLVARRRYRLNLLRAPLSRGFFTSQQHSTTSAKEKK